MALNLNLSLSKMIRKMKIYKILGLLLMLPSMIFSQQIIPISKMEVLEKVKNQNHDLKIGVQEVLVAQGDYQQTNGIFLPSLRASHTAMATTNPLMAFGFKLNQEIITQADFDPNALNNPSQVRMFTTKLEFEQPIFNLDGVYHRKAAKATWEATQLQLNRSEDYLAFETKNAYMQLQVAYKSEMVLERTLEAVLENLRWAENSQKQGYLQYSDVLAVQVRVNEVRNQLQYAKSNIVNASEYLALLMNENIEGILQPMDSLSLQTEWEIRKEVSDNRADIQAMEKVVEAYKQNHQADKMLLLPRVNAFGNYELYDDQLFHANANGYLIGAALTWDVFDGSKRSGKSKKSKAELEKANLELEQYKSENQLELNKAIRTYQDAKNNVSLTELAMEQSKKALEIRNNRFKEGLEKTSDLLLAETQYQQKQLEYYYMVYQHNYALNYLQLLTKAN